MILRPRAAVVAAPEPILLHDAELDDGSSSNSDVREDEAELVSALLGLYPNPYWRSVSNLIRCSPHHHIAGV
jgi:hypothetical protein